MVENVTILFLQVFFNEIDVLIIQSNQNLAFDLRIMFFKIFLLQFEVQNV